MLTKHLFVLIHPRKSKRLVPKASISPPVFLLTIQDGAYFLDPLILLLFMFRVLHAVLFVHCSLGVTYWERAYLLVHFYLMFSCVFRPFPVWCPESGVILDCIDS